MKRVFVSLYLPFKKKKDRALLLLQMAFHNLVNFCHNVDGMKATRVCLLFIQSQQLPIINTKRHQDIQISYLSPEFWIRYAWFLDAIRSIHLHIMESSHTHPRLLSTSWSNPNRWFTDKKFKIFRFDAYHPSINKPMLWIWDQEIGNRAFLLEIWQAFAFYMIDRSA